jgi:hypothetical protein
MNIQEITEKFKGFLNNPEYVLTILIVCVSLSSFWLGRISAQEQAENVPKMQSATVVTGGSNTGSNDTRKAENGVTETKRETPAEGGYVASKSGTKYHLPWCGSAKQIKEENKIWFATKEEAEKAGYTPASNCKGI